MLYADPRTCIQPWHLPDEALIMARVTEPYSHSGACMGSWTLGKADNPLFVFLYCQWRSKPGVAVTPRQSRSLVSYPTLRIFTPPNWISIILCTCSSYSAINIGHMRQKRVHEILEVQVKPEADQRAGPCTIQLQSHIAQALWYTFLVISLIVT
jgi:hypothetical protein